MKYRTVDGDVLDAICAKYYDGDVSMIDNVLANNPGLASMGTILPAGVIIDLPPAQQKQNIKQTIRLWD